MSQGGGTTNCDSGGFVCVLGVEVDIKLGQIWPILYLLLPLKTHTQTPPQINNHGSVSHEFWGPLDPNYGGETGLQVLLPLNTHRFFRTFGVTEVPSHTLGYWVWEERGGGA